MSRRNKLEKFTDLLQYSHVYESFEFRDEKLTRTIQEKLIMRGKWNLLQFENNNPIVLELACGRGEYSLDLARRYPDKNFIGVDVKGARIWKGATIALQENLNNVAFLRTRIEQLELFFKKEEIDEIWITFPDPFKRDSQENRRLTAAVFLEKYQLLLKNGGVLHLKTDSNLLFNYSKQSIENYPATRLLKVSDNIYKDELPHPDLDILTYYEKQHLAENKSIKYLCFGYENT
ncbi:MAG: tRNA (guanosine(46)-N7)-methyltransferase TrmB [Saprospirales bacterium]|nr:MAG: tRNA (guanosine(46)-N7)-methyltransferase TrmB [Saprospirales bacterium]